MGRTIGNDCLVHPSAGLHRPATRPLRSSRPGAADAALTRALAEAIPRGELSLHYQPKLAIRRQRIAAAEALLRWQHPQRGPLLPDAFVPQAEAGGIMRPVAFWTLARMIEDQRELVGADGPLRLFMNVSGSLLTDAEFIEHACERVAGSGASIGFEVTETSVIEDPEVAIANLARCSAAGIAIAIDDYGTGLSSLIYLKRLPAQELKIDKAFITGLTRSNRDPLIVRSTIDLAHALGMEVTAEGVETPAALALLSVMGCEMAQGFLISHPLTIDKLKAYLAAFDFEALALTSPPAFIRPESFWKSA